MNESYTTTEAAQKLNLSRARVLQFIRENRLVATQRGRDYFIEKTELERFAAVPRGLGKPRRTAAQIISNTN